MAESTSQSSPLSQPANPAAPVEGRYEEIVARLSKVVERLEGGGLSLEESIAAFEDGVRLARAGARRLDEAEKKVELLLENDRTQAFVSASAADGETKRR